MGVASLLKVASQFLTLTQKVADTHRKPLVLCVEDDEDILGMLKLMLENRGYHVLSASSVEKALDLAATHDNISSLITDFEIGNKSATDLISALGDRKPKNVVLLSGKQFAGDPKEEVPGINSHVSKPFSFKNLIEKIDSKN